MATLITNAATTQNLTGAATFAAAETGTGALNLLRNSTSSLATASSVTSATFTVTNTKVIDAVLLWVQTSGTVGTGTFKVDLQKGGVSQASVTVNKSDLPDSTNSAPIPVLFKLTSTATGDGGSNWTIVLTTTSGTGNATITYNHTGSSTSFTRALRTTTAATLAAADDFYIVGELTGAGTHNSRTVTMNSTAATAYGSGTVNSTSVSGGGGHVSCYGTLSYGTSSATNYVLRMNGDLIVYQFGTLNIGSSGAEIPRDSTAVLEFQLVSADGDFGLRFLDNCTYSIAGLSRTSGKNVTQCKLTSSVASSNVITSGPTTTNGSSSSNNGLEATGNSLLARTFSDNGTNATHSDAWSAPAVSNTTQTASVWIARGSGTNNRFVRITMGNNTNQASVTNGFFSDLDLQAGTAGTVTAVGNGTATSVSITAVKGGFLVRMTGKVSSGSATPSLLLNACSAAGTLSFAGASNQCFIYDHTAIVTASSISDTTFNVDTDTGWLNGDAICVAPTTQTASQSEIYPLNADAGASSFTSALYPFNGTVAATHHGTSPVQAEIGLITRNVKVRSTSLTLNPYVYIAGLATGTISWAEFYYIGNASGTGGKRGLQIDGAVGAPAKSVTYCSFHDTDSYAVYCSTQASTLFNLNLTFSNNVFWNTGNQNAFIIDGPINATDWTVSSNLSIFAQGYAFMLIDLGGTFTNNIAAGWTNSNSAMVIAESNNVYGSLGTFSGNVAHSGSSSGLRVGNQGAAFIGGIVDGFTSYRCTNGIQFNGATSTSNLWLNNLTLFGHSGIGIDVGSGDGLNIGGTSNIIAGDTTFAMARGIRFQSPPAVMDINISNVDFSGTTSIFAPCTLADMSWSNSATPIAIFTHGQMNNCKFGAPTAMENIPANFLPHSYLGFEKYNQTAGDHRMQMKYGVLRTDTAIYNTASPSVRMTPSNASNKLESAPKGCGFKIPVTSGNTAAVAVYIYKSKTGDGAAYNGNQPRLIQRANPALGQNSDVVLGTYSAGTGSWNQLSANTSTSTDDGAWEIIVDCDGTAGWINVDDWQVA